MENNGNNQNNTQEDPLVNRLFNKTKGGSDTATTETDKNKNEESLSQKLYNRTAQDSYKSPSEVTPQNNEKLLQEMGVLPAKKPDYGVTSFDEGISSGWDQLKAGGAKFVGEGLGLLGFDETEKDLSQYAENTRKNAYRSDDSVGFFLGSLVPSTAPTAAAIAASPFTAGTSLSAVPGLLSIGALSASAAGSGMMEYETYQKSKGREADPLTMWAVGSAMGLAEGAMERLQVDKLVPGVAKKALKNTFLKGNLNAAEQAGKDLLDKFRKQAPEEYKRLSKKFLQAGNSEGMQEVATETAQVMSEVLYKDSEDLKESFKQLPSRVGQAYLGGLIMGAGLGPLSYAAQNKVNRDRRKKQGKVIIAENTEDGEAYELIAPVENEQFTGYQALSKNGEEAMIPRESVGEVAELTPSQFDKLLQDKLDQQEFERAQREPVTVASYQGEDVKIKGPDGEGGVYVTMPDGRDVSLKPEELEDMQEIPVAEQMAAEGTEVVDQPAGPVEALREEQDQQQAPDGGVLRNAEGDFVYPGEEGYDQLQQQQGSQPAQQATQQPGAVGANEPESQQPASPPRELTVGKGKSKQKVVLQPQQDGSYTVQGRRVVENDEVVEQATEDLTDEELNDLKAKVEKSFASRGNFDVVTALSDPNDTLSPMQLRVVPFDSEERAAEERSETIDQGYEVQAEGSSVKVVNTQNDREVGSRSPYYLPKLKAYFKANAETLSQMPRATDNERGLTEENYIKEVASSSENPVELSEAFLEAQRRSAQNNNTDQVKMSIAHRLGKGRIHPDEIAQWGDRNQFEGSQGIAYANYTSRNAPRDLDVMAEIISDETGQPVEPWDIIDFMVEYPNGPKEYLNQEDEIVENLRERFQEITGVELSSGLAETIAGVNVRPAQSEDTRQAESGWLSDEEMAQANTEFEQLNREIEQTKSELNQEGVPDEEIQQVEQAADQSSEEEIASLESEVEALEGEQEQLTEEELAERVDSIGSFFTEQAEAAEQKAPTEKTFEQAPADPPDEQAQPDTGSSQFKDGWRESIFKARDAAQKIGVSIQGKDLATIIADVEQAIGSTQESEPAQADDTNYLFSEEQAEKDRETLRKGFSQLNAGIDPQLLAAGIRMAGYKIERGARSFSNFAREMIAEFGEGIRPYLKSFYNGIRDYPEFDNTDMTAYDQVAGVDVDAIDAGDTSAETQPPPQEQNTGEDQGDVNLQEDDSDAAKSSSQQESGEQPQSFTKPDGFTRPAYTAAAYTAVSGLPDFERFSPDNFDTDPGYFRRYESNTYDNVAIESQPLPEQLQQYDDPDAYMLIMEQYYRQNGDLMSDPRIDVAVYPTLNMVVPLTYTNSGAGVYQEVYDQKGNPNTSLRNELASFTADWIDTLQGQGIFDQASEQETSEQPDAQDSEPSAQPTEDNDQAEEFIADVTQKIAAGEQLNKTQLEKIGRTYGIESANEAKEQAEYAIVKMAREIAGSGGTLAENYPKVVQLYENQPNLTHRTSESVAKQQYSTPVPISYLAGVYTNLDAGVAGFEPSAGNGILTVAAGEPSNIIANEIDTVRLQNLQDQGFYEVTDRDGTNVFDTLAGTQQAMVTNPPFGGLDTKVGIEARGQLGTFGITKLEHLMAIRGLDTLRDDGKAAIIIGGHNRYSGKGILKGADGVFFNYLYNQYNVEDVINISGDLYRKQGTRFPIRMILVNGRKGTPEGFAPLETDNNNAVVENFPQLYSRVKKHITEANNEPILQSELDGNRGASDAVSGESAGSDQNQDVGGPATLFDQRDSAADRDGGPERSPRRPADFLTDDRGSAAPGSTDGSGSQPTAQDGSRPDSELSGLPESDQQPAATDQGQSDESQADATRPSARGVSRTQSRVDSGVTVGDVLDDASGNVVYSPLSDNYSLETEMPASMAFPMIRALNSLADKHGNVDQFVTDKLRYDSVEDLYDVLSAEQIDAVALGIDQVESGKGMIIGDQTGIGKGRVGAAMVRYGVLAGKKPIFFTEKKKLFSDLYRDLSDIGSAELVPFIMNNDGSVQDADGKQLHKGLSRNKQKTFLKGNTALDGYDFILTTYSQIQSGQATDKKAFITRMAEGNIFVMDESHNASGSSNTGEFIMDRMEQAQGAMYLSATFAKRADNFPVYAMKTAISDVSMTTDEMVTAIESGGFALQEILSADLVKAGQMIRRQRNFDGVEVNYEMLGVDADGNPDAQGREHRRIYDSVAEIVRDVIGFQEDHVAPIIDKMDKELKGQRGEASTKKGTSKMGVDNFPFVSKVHMVVDQLLFSLKADAVADATIESLKADRKPVIAFKNTMESFFKHEGYGPGDTLENTSFARTLERGLDGVMRYIQKDYKGDETHSALGYADLTSSGQKAYDRLKAKINTTSAGISLSPLDVIINRLEAEGYSVGEVTGRNIQLQMNADGSALVKKKELSDANSIFRMFNNGELDVLMVNSSGATGASAHASEKFDDQRAREMIIHQPELNINTEVQKRGRINRTGQVVKPSYRYITSAIPAESRLMMMLKNKLKSLDANTTSNQKTSNKLLEFDDFINQYGDEIVTDYLIENSDLNTQLLDPIKMNDRKSDDFTYEGGARKVTGRIAFMPSEVQEEFYREVGQRYSDYIEYLNQIGENKLTIESHDLQAKTIDKRTTVIGKKPQSPFGTDTVLERVEANVLRKPYRMEEITQLVDEQLGGQTPTGYIDGLIQQMKASQATQMQQKLESINQRYDEKLDGIGDQLDYEADQAAGAEDSVPYDREGRRKEITESIESQREGAQERAVDRFETQSDYVRKRLFGSYTPGDVYIVPQDEKGQTIGRSSNAVFIGFDINENRKNPFAPSAIKAKFATADGRRYLSVPGSVKPFFDATISNTRMVSGENRRKMKANWDTNLNHSDRERRYIATGNILQALNKYPSLGQLITYTTENGNLKNGIYMPQNFDPAETQKGGRDTVSAPFSRAFGYLTSNASAKVTSTNEDIEIRKSTSGKTFELQVPGSKKWGGKYFLDETLQGLMRGDTFDKYGGTFNASFDKGRLKDVLQYFEDEFSMSVELPRSAVEQAGDDAIRFSRLESGDQPTSIDRVNGKFNQDLQDYIEGELDSGSVLRLGEPGAILRRAGVAGGQIRLTQSTIKQKARTHGIPVKAIKDLPKAINNPIMVYNWGGKVAKSHNILTELEHKGNKILVAIGFEKGGETLEINEIKSFYPKDISRFLNEITPKRFQNEDLQYVDKKRALEWIDTAPTQGERQPKQELIQNVRSIIENFNNTPQQQAGGVSTSKPSLKARQIQRELEQITGDWAARELVQVASHPDQLPAGLQQRLQQETGRIGGVFYEGRAYVLAYNLNDSKEALAALYHETIGHVGVRGLIRHISGSPQEFNQRLKALSNDVYDAFKDDAMFTEIVDTYGLDMRRNDHKQQAAEEFLAHMAETDPKSSWVERFTELVNDILKRLGVKKGLTKRDVRNMLADARRFVEEGPIVYADGSLRPAFSIAGYMDDWQPGDSEQRFQVLGWHGSPHVFNKFSTDAIGTGEGAQAFGWGLYFTEKEDIARWYADSLRRTNDFNFKINGKKIPEYSVNILKTYFLNPTNNPNWENISLAELQEEAKEQLELSYVKSSVKSIRKVDEIIDKMAQQILDADSFLAERKSSRNLYKVTIHDGKEPGEYDWLDWDGEISKQRYEQIKSQLVQQAGQDAFTDDQKYALDQEFGRIDRNIDREGFTIKGEGIYRMLQRSLGSQKAASQWLLKNGTDGIRYPANQGRSDGNNYVVFDEDVVSIDEHVRYKRLGTLDETQHQYKKRFDNLQRKYQDAFVALKRTQQGVVDEGGTLTDQSNTYREETLSYGRVESQQKKLKEQHRDPLLKEMRRLYNQKGIEYADVRKFLYARHAPERNDYMYQRNPEAGRAQSGMSDTQAAGIIQEFQGKGWGKDLRGVARRVDAITEATLDNSVSSGLMSGARYGSLKKQYKNYVPLRGFAEFMGVDTTLYSGDLAAEGRQSEAGDILGYVFAMADTSIIAGEKNKVKQTLLTFVEQNYQRSDLFRIKNVFFRPTGEIDEATGKAKWVPTYSKPTTQELLDGTVKRHLDYDNETALWSESGSPFDESSLRVMVDGRPVVIEFTEPHIAAAFKKQEVHKVQGLLATANRYMRYLRHTITQYSPEFGPRNLLRDSFTGAINLSIDLEGATAAKIVNPYTMGKGMGALWRAFRRGDYSGEWGQAMKDFEEYGSMSGYWELDQVQERTKNFKEMVEDGGITENPWYNTKKGVKALGQWFDDYNRTLENVFRLSTFKHLVDNKTINPKTKKPFTKTQAASYAKNLTVNFNRKGTESNFVGSLYLFFNAAVQGISRQAQPFFSGDTRTRWRAAAAPVIMGATAYAMIELMRASLGKDEDDEYFYDKINEWTRMHNIILPNWASDDPQDYIKIPLPYGYNVYWAAGDVMNRFIYGETDVPDAAMEMATATVDAYNPIGTANASSFGVGTYKSFLPTIFKPGFELAYNENFAGSPIKPEPFPFAPDEPESQQYFPWVSTWAKETALYLNKVSGGDEVTSGLVDVSPEYLEYLTSYFGGGTATFLTGLVNTGTNVSDQLNGTDELEKYDMFEVPFARSYYGVITDSPTRRAFYENADTIENLMNRYDTYYENGDIGKAQALYDEKKAVMLMEPRLKAIKKQMRSLRKMQRAYEEQGTKAARKNADKVGESIHQLHLAFNKMMNQTTENPRKNPAEFLKQNKTKQE